MKAGVTEKIDKERTDGINRARRARRNGCGRGRYRCRQHQTISHKTQSRYHSCPAIFLPVGIVVDTAVAVEVTTGPHKPSKVVVEIRDRRTVGI